VKAFSGSSLPENALVSTPPGFARRLVSTSARQLFGLWETGYFMASRIML
jgi:hypothetical protein